MRIALRTPSARAIATSSGCATVRRVLIRFYNLDGEPGISLNAGRLQCLGRGGLAVDSAEHSKNGQLLGETLECELTERFRREAADDAIERVLRDDDLTGLRDAA